MKGTRPHGPAQWGSAAAVVLGVVAVLAAQDVPPRVVIAAPRASDFVSGPTTLRADIGSPERVSTVTFEVQGRQVCVLARPPFECSYDAGPSVQPLQIRLSVEFADGTPRGVHTIRTSSLDINETVSVNAKEVTVTVTDGDKPVGGLSRDRFRVFEDDRLQSISTFASEKIPLELVVAVDISGSMLPAINGLRTAVRGFLRAVPEGDPVTVLAFNDRILTLARRATTPDARELSLSRLAAYGPTTLYDAVVRGTDMLAALGGRKALVVFSDGEDSGSRVALDDVERRLLGRDVTLYMIAQGRGLTHENLKQVMEKLVKPTGGRLFSTDDIDDLEEAFDELLEELSNQYLLSYQSTNPSRDSAWRRIRVEVDGYSDVRAQDGYRVVPLR